MSSSYSLLETLRGRDSRILTGSGSISDQVLADRIKRTAEKLDRAGLTRVASQLDNGPHWLILDLALRELGAVHIPLPTFFSSNQALHALQSSGAQAVVAEQRAPTPIGRMSWSDCLRTVLFIGVSR